MSKLVAVIGCGPAGLAAVHAAVGLGHDVELYAPMSKSPLRGPLLLQRPIPAVTLTHPDAYVAQLVIGGSILDYRYKLYGDVNININGDILEKGYHAWKLSAAYDSMWSRYVDNAHRQVWTVERDVSPSALVGISGRFDAVINTAPADRFCMKTGEHEFVSKSVSLVVNALAMIDQPDNTIYFNADKAVPWVRSSHIFGSQTIEYPFDSAPPLAIDIRKPIRTDCDCHPRVFRTGRFGSWRNETWVDTAYFATREALMGV